MSKIKVTDTAASVYKEVTDEQLALLYAEGNNKAFDELLSRTNDKLFTYIMYMVKDETLANDLFQETYIKAIVKLRNHQYNPSGKFIFWMTRIAHNVIIDHFRDQKSENIVEQRKDNDLQNLKMNSVLDTYRESELVNEQIKNDVVKLMNSLPDTQREVVYMRFFQEMSFKEIAEETGVSINTSLGRMRYALINLRKMTRQHNINLCLE
jgi:RNA polymerase sigma-70 factor (ECF subfamily)